MHSRPARRPSSMEQVSVLEEIGASVNTVWLQIRDFGNIGAWAYGATLVRVEGSGVGAERIVKSPAGLFIERCEAHDEDGHSFSYSIVDSPWRLDCYVACVRLSPLPSGCCAIEWSCRFGTSSNLQTGFKDRIERMYRRFIATLRQSVTSSARHGGEM
jgi:Polyketide cyclase / dehydrase and lipid transport